MDQIRIGAFLKALRKEKGLTQEQLAEKLAVSGRTVSRWETGSNMPDIGMLVVLADFYGVSIPELINGERKSENMNQETRDTAIAMAEYSQVTAKSSRRKVIGILFITFGLFIIISALSIFPSESSWGSIYATLGSIILIAGIYLIIRQLVAKRAVRLSLVFGCAVLLFGAFTLSDYIAVTQFHQVPRFSYETVYDSRLPDQLVHKNPVLHRRPAKSWHPGGAGLYRKIDPIKSGSPCPPSPQPSASRSIRPQAKPPCGRFQRASPAGPAPPGGLRPPPSPRELPRPRWAETFSLPANLAFGVSQKPKPPLCKGRRREAPEGSFWDRLQLFQNDGSVTAPPTQGSLREPQGAF